MSDEQSLQTTTSKVTGKNGKWKGVAKTAEDVQDQVMDTAKQAINGMSERASDLTQRATDLAQRATSAVENYNVNPRGFIQQYPMQAAIGGLVIGFILGTAISRRSVS